LYTITENKKLKSEKRAVEKLAVNRFVNTAKLPFDPLNEERKKVLGRVECRSGLNHQQYCVDKEQKNTKRQFGTEKKKVSL